MASCLSLIDFGLLATIYQIQRLDWGAVRLWFEAQDTVPTLPYAELGKKTKMFGN